MLRPWCLSVVASDPVLPVVSAVELFDMDGDVGDVGDDDDVVDGRLNVTCFTDFLPYAA